MMRRLALVAVAVVACAATACRGMRLHGEAEESAARQLVGTWDASFTLTRSDGGATQQPVRGTIAFVREHSGHVWSPQVSGVEEYGVYDIDFRPFGFDSRDGESSSTARSNTTASAAIGRPIPASRPAWGTSP